MTDSCTAPRSPRRPAHAEPPTFMRDALRALSAAMGVAGIRDRAIYWYRNTPIPDGRHLTAEHLVSTDEPNAVDFYLVSIESGPAE